MTTLQVGVKAPDFTLPTDGGENVRLSSLAGQKVVLFFYPKDNTPGCTKEACSFRDNISAFGDLNTAIIGISKDSVTKHDNFKAKHELNFPLASDADSDVCEQYGVFVEKNMYGKKYMGIERSTFLIDESGIIRQIWRKVKVDGHIQAVEQAVSNLVKAA